MGLFGEFIDVSQAQTDIERALSDIDKKIQDGEDRKCLRNKCDKCSLKVQCQEKNTEAMYIGSGHKKILVVCDSPELSSIVTKNYRSGEQYEFLKEEFYKSGVDLDRDCWMSWAVRYPVDKVKDGMRNNCRYQLFRTIRKLKPEKIILVGKDPVAAILEHRASSRVKTGDIVCWAGWQIPDQELKAMVYPVFDPVVVRWMKSFVLDKSSRKLIRDALKDHKTFHKYDYSSECGYLDNEQEAISWIKTCQKAKRVAFDYETTGLKPDKKGHKIICVSISNGIMSFGFEMYASREFRYELAQLLQNKKIQKVAHNHKYEETWTEVLLGYKVANWYFDPYVAQHIMDNRPGITGLKFLSYVHYGNMGYDNRLDPYIEYTRPGDDSDSANRINMMEYAPIDEVCLYCAEDSHLTYKIADNQIAHMDGHRRKGFDLFMKSSSTYVGMERNGVNISTSGLMQAEKDVLNYISEANEAIQNDPDVAKWREINGHLFDQGSTDDLKDFIYAYMGEKVKKKTKGGEPSTDKSVLEDLAKQGKSAVYGHIQKYRKWSKVLEYVVGIKREVVDGTLHCFFGLGNVSTYRTSSNSINLQNIPKRDKEVKQLLRDVFIPTPGHQFMEYDFRAFEVSMYACYSRDEVLMEYARNLSKDMHRDMGAYIMKYSWDDMIAKFDAGGAKAFRQETKSGFVFSQLYGASADTSASYFWEFFKTEEGSKYWDDFSSRTGMESYQEWLEWIKSVENYFWNILFPDLGAWRERNWKKYTESGRIRYFTGFYAIGNLAKTQATNFAIQGTAAHVKLMTMNLLSDKLKKDGAKSKVFCEIHDSLVLDAHPEEEEYLDKVMTWIVNVRIPEMCPWAVVPFYVEKAVGGVDESWSTVDEVGIINAV